jgi:hypothetical protein
MPDESTKQEIRDRLAASSKAISRFRPRAAQCAMIAEVAKTLARCPDPNSSDHALPVGETVFVVQGGTGIGKSLGYFLLAKLKGKKLVISSSTAALQEQLAGRASCAITGSPKPLLARGKRPCRGMKDTLSRRFSIAAPCAVRSRQWRPIIPVGAGTETVIPAKVSLRSFGNPLPPIGMAALAVVSAPSSGHAPR